MIDISQLKYRLVLLDETGTQYDLKDIIQDLGWEENENELAARITFKLAKIDREGIADGLMKNGRMVFLMAQTGEAEAEVCRGFIKTHQDSYSLTARPVDGTAYDMLHQLDRSQDNRHITSGRTTKTIIFEIAADWGIPISEYQGPDVAHGKMDFKSKPPAKMFMELLDDAKKKGAGEYVLRADQGTIRVLPVMGNQNIYVFKANNSVQVSHKESITDMVTRVKVIGQGKGKGNPPVEAVLDGRTEFGVLQKLYQRSSDETIEAAKQAAQELLKEDGTPDEDITLSLPDVPYVRKGDAIYCDRLESVDGYYRVLSVSHDCDERTMTVRVKKAEMPAMAQDGAQAAANYTVGSEVIFSGGTHYVSSDSGSRGYTVKGSGKAKITRIAEGKAHPYHLIHSDSGCNVYGWVDAGTFH